LIGNEKTLRRAKRGIVIAEAIVDQRQPVADRFCEGRFMREMSLSFLDDGLARGSETALMYIFDPDRGGRHRAIARDATHIRIRTPFTSLFGADPKSRMDDDLMWMKSFIETEHQLHDA
jgi:hypothetical protein